MVDSPQTPCVIRYGLWSMVYGLFVVMLWGSGGVGDAWAEQQDQKRTYDSKGKRDPFVALVRDGRLVGSTTEASPRMGSTPLLAGILWDPGGHSIALINDTEVTVGDTIGGYQVAEIRQDAVVLVRGEESVVLQITFEETGKPKQPQDIPRGGERP